MLHFLLNIVCLLGRGHTDLGVTCLRKIICFYQLPVRKEENSTQQHQGLGIILRVSGDAGPSLLFHHRLPPIHLAPTLTSSQTPSSGMGCCCSFDTGPTPQPVLPLAKMCPTLRYLRSPIHLSEPCPEVTEPPVFPCRQLINDPFLCGAFIPSVYFCGCIYHTVVQLFACRISRGQRPFISNL